MDPKGVGHTGFCLPLLTIHIPIIRNEDLSEFRRNDQKVFKKLVFIVYHSE